MSRLDQLPEISDHVLSGLQADESLKFRIYQKAAGISDKRDNKKTARLPLAALCAISVVMIAAFVLLRPLSQNIIVQQNTNISTEYQSPLNMKNSRYGGDPNKESINSDDHDSSAEDPDDADSGTEDEKNKTEDSADESEDPDNQLP